MNIENKTMASLAPPAAIVPCPTAGILVVRARHTFPADVALAGVDVRLSISGVVAQGTTEPSGGTAFVITPGGDDMSSRQISYRLVDDTEWRKVDFPVALAVNETRVQFIDSQRIGWELECASVKMKTLGLPGDTYGIPIVHTTQKGYKDLPIVEVQLEERKELEDPKIEIVTAPVMKADLPRIRDWMLAILKKGGFGKPAAWAASVDTVPCTATGELADYVLYRPGGTELVQGNVDVYLDQLYTEHAFFETMMAGERVKYYAKARECVTATVDHGSDARGHVAGLLTYALYAALMDDRYHGVQDTLGKDRAQPLIKAGVDDLARNGLDAGERRYLFEVVTRLVAPPSAEHFKTLCASPDSAMRRLNTENAVRASLIAWFQTRTDRYPGDLADPHNAGRIRALGDQVIGARRRSDGGCSKNGCSGNVVAKPDTYTCGACGVVHNAQPNNGAPGVCCSDAVVKRADHWTCPVCRTGHAVHPLNGVCCVGAVDKSSYYRCGVCHTRHESSPRDGVCCTGKLSSQVRYKCARGHVQDARGTCTTPGCRAITSRDTTKVCVVCNAPAVSTATQCLHRVTKHDEWTCRTCGAVTNARPPSGDCKHVVTKDADLWDCATCGHVHQVNPPGGLCVHNAEKDPDALECDTCNTPHSAHPGQCPSGKPLKPRKIHGRTMVVAEVRHDNAVFNQTYYYAK